MNEYATILDNPSESQKKLLEHIMKYSSFPLSERKKDLIESISKLNAKHQIQISEHDQKLISDKDFDEHMKAFNYRLYEFEHKTKSIDHDIIKGSLFIKRIRKCINFINQVYQNPENKRTIIEQTNIEMKKMIIDEIKEVLITKIDELYAELKRNNALNNCGILVGGVSFNSKELEEKNHDLSKLEGELEFFSDEKNTIPVLDTFDISTMNFELLKCNNVRVIYDYLELQQELKNRKGR